MWRIYPILDDSGGKFGVADHLNSKIEVISFRGELT